MKRLIVVLLLCFAFTSLFSQKEPSKKEQKAEKIQTMQAIGLKDDGNKALAVKDYKTALAKYEMALAEWGNHPADFAMIYAMGTCAYSLNDMPKSLKYFDMCIAGGHKLDMTYPYKACVLKAMKNEPEYLKTLKAGLSKVPNSKSMKDMMGKYYFEEGDKFYHKAIETMKNASAMVKSGKTSSSDKAFKEMNDKARLDFRECIKWMDMSLEANPNDENAKVVKKNCATQLQMLI